MSTMWRNVAFPPLTKDKTDAARRQAKAARAAYMRKYRREHPDKIKAINEAYWLRKALQEADRTDAEGD